MPCWTVLISYSLSWWTVCDVYPVLLNHMWYIPCLVELYVMYSLSCLTMFDKFLVLLNCMWCIPCFVELSVVYSMFCWTICDIFLVLLNHMWCILSLAKPYVTWTVCGEFFAAEFRVMCPSLTELCVVHMTSQFGDLSRLHLALCSFWFRSEFKGKMAQNEFVNAFLQFQALLHLAAGKKWGR